MSDTEADGDGGREYDPDATNAFPDERVNAVLSLLESDPEVDAYLAAQNVNPVQRKEYNDHGQKHIEIVRNRALCLYDLLKRGGVEFNGAREQGLDEADEPVIVALAATLHAILCHHTEETPLTLEAGVVRVADALDMEQGRSRIPYERGGRGIDTLSSQAIQRVSLSPGDDRPVLVEIEMNAAAGVYQVDELLTSKLHASGLEEQVRIVAVNTEDDGTLVERIEL